MLNTYSALLASASCVYAASQIALFSDSNCQDSYKGLEGLFHTVVHSDAIAETHAGPNGYPNGSCTDMRRSGDYGSLQVVGLDAGCAVTIYLNDDTTSICGGYQQEIQLAQCWNSSFVYYSIDMCDMPDPSSSSLATPTASTAPSSPSGPTTGTLVGGIIGGLGGLALILGIALWVLARKKRDRRAAAMEERHAVYAEADAHPYRTEMDGSYRRHEMDEGKAAYKHQAAEVAQPPVELGGHELGWRRVAGL